MLPWTRNGGEKYKAGARKICIERSAIRWIGKEGEDPCSRGRGYQIGYQGGLPQYVPRSIIKEMDTQETGFQIDDSDEEEQTLVENAGFIAVNEPMMIKEEEEDSRFIL